ncbi:ribonuclease E inhibitor RraB [Paraglaciecola aquimarina]|uniref:Regulator of ribonuclease activity B n=1 Tax=Paraglaciecola algarum TaxID=3050085 RepID=A0ABS9D4P5_9ALTE|nr:ribonuclease E inhibitor RraB [Paraglaciecola sp. G1-23]MCF2947885.1 ribonuclease E inhibitor RraB [Paraglaciecola sp. G1-23]
MSTKINPELVEWYEFNQETIDALKEDGSDVSQAHIIEYHFASTDFEALEKAAVDAFKAGFEVGDAEELELDDGGEVWCFDAVVERMLEPLLINQDTDKLFAVAEKHKVHYDGWGTYFIEQE